MLGRRTPLQPVALTRGALAVDVGFAFDHATETVPVPQSLPDPRVRTASARPRLSVVAAHRTRHGRRVMGVLTLIVVVTLLAGIALHAELASRQLVLDGVNNDIATTEDRYQRLRASVAVLEAPARLRSEATLMGLVPAAQVEFFSSVPSGGSPTP